ncbi:MAG TPA: DUF4235 domain-containing protein [Actinopolymorphaceae bacterium]
MEHSKRTNPIGRATAPNIKSRRSGTLDGSKVGWLIVRSASTLVAVAATKKVIDVGWRFVTGEDPPKEPEDPDLTWKQAVSWTLASGIGIAVARLLAGRQAARMWRKWTGQLPPGIRADD